tara:strand:- start:1272 stop:2000 length:729 start_codon:yes stop_codon:yes gene_type:complete
MFKWEANRKQGDILRKDELGKLFLTLINNELNIEDASEKSGLSIEKVATLISNPESELFFEKKGDVEITFCCKYEWISDSISKKVGLRDGEKEILANILSTKFPKHAANYWAEDGIISRDLEARDIEEWIENEICFLAGFAVWFREKEKDGEVDLSSLVSEALGKEVSVEGQIDFDRKRIELLSELPSNALNLIKEMNPAGKVAYRSMDMAVIQGLSEGNSELANEMKQRTQSWQKPWWKFW